MNETLLAKPPVYGPDRTEQDREISVVDLLIAILRYRRTVVVCVVVCVFVSVLPLVFRSASYTATASFIVRGDETGRSGLSGIAGQLGVSMPVGAGQSPQFYADLLKTREILRPIVGDSFRVAPTTRPTPFVELFGIAGDNPALRRDVAVQMLADQLIEAHVGRTSDVVSVGVTSRWPSVSYAVLQRLLDGLNAFTVKMRQTQAASDRQYSEERLAEAHAALEGAENRLEQWLQANRVWQTSPDLVLMHDRLQREVSLQQQIFATSAQSLEEARSRELRSTPILTIVDPPVVPTSPNPKGRVRRAVVGLLFGLLFGILLALGRYVIQYRDDDRAVATLRMLTREARRDLIPWRSKVNPRKDRHP